MKNRIKPFNPRIIKSLEIYHCPFFKMFTFHSPVTQQFLIWKRWRYSQFLFDLLILDNIVEIRFAWGSFGMASNTICKEWTGKTIYLNFSSIFGDFFLKFFEEEVSDYLSWPDSYVLYVCAHNYTQNFHQGDCMQSSSKVVDSKFSI